MKALSLNFANGKASHVNIMLDGCMYPGSKLVQIILPEKTCNVNNTHQPKPLKGAGIW
jgi:hypothetical protein